MPREALFFKNYVGIFKLQKPTKTICFERKRDLQIVQNKFSLVAINFIKYCHRFEVDWLTMGGGGLNSWTIRVVSDNTSRHDDGDRIEIGYPLSVDRRKVISVIFVTVSLTAWTTETRRAGGPVRLAETGRVGMAGPRLRVFDFRPFPSPKRIARHRQAGRKIVSHT